MDTEASPSIKEEINKILVNWHHSNVVADLLT